MNTNTSLDLSPSLARHGGFVRPVILAFLLSTPIMTNAQIIIGSLGMNGKLAASGLEPGSLATVEWAPAVQGPWSSSWAELVNVTVDATGAIQTGGELGSALDN